MATSYNPSQVYVPNWSADGLAYPTNYSYDSIGRVMAVTTADNSTTTYAGNVTTVTDATSDRRISGANFNFGMEA